MGKADEALRRYAGEEYNCDVRVADAGGASSSEGEAHIPVFAGAALLAVFAPGLPVHAGDAVVRRQDGRRFRVVRLLNTGKDGRVHAQLERVE